ncbi:hypothetical protein MRX96_001170 [Rhipicephalus microplus]
MMIINIMYLVKGKLAFSIIKPTYECAGHELQEEEEPRATREDVAEVATRLAVPATGHVKRAQLNPGVLVSSPSSPSSHSVIKTAGIRLSTAKRSR